MKTFTFRIESGKYIYNTYIDNHIYEFEIKYLKNNIFIIENSLLDMETTELKTIKPLFLGLSPSRKNPIFILKDFMLRDSIIDNILK